LARTAQKTPLPTSPSPSPSHIATDGLSVSKSWCRAPSRAHDQIFIAPRLLGSCFCGAPSLTRGWVCLLYMLLALASAGFLGSESLGTRDHILLSLSYSLSNPLGLSKCSADRKRDTIRQGSISCVRQSVVTQRAFHFWGNAFVDSASPAQRLTVITLPWKCLLQTRYSMMNQ
jgi:hypothetical protein